MAQSENQLTHREAQEGQDARYEELRSSADSLIQTKREETDPAMHETSHRTVKPRLSAGCKRGNAP